MTDSSCQTSKSPTIPQRWVIVALSFLGLCNAFSMRVCLSIAITEMTIPRNHTAPVNSDDTCMENYSFNNTHLRSVKHSNSVKYDWDERTQGLILSSFYWGYVISCVLGGVICQKFGGKHTLGMNILLTSIFTLLTPSCIYWGGSTSLIVLRIAMGLGEGTAYPAISDLLAKWIPQHERSKAGFIAFSGGTIGTIFGMLVSGIILHHTETGWPMVFYFYGIFGVISFLLNAAFCYSSPNENPYITHEELTYLQNKIKNTHTNLPPIPWRHILKSPAVWASIIAKYGNACGNLTIISDMPKYMSSVLKFSVMDNGFITSIPQLSTWIGGMLTCWIADKVIADGKMSITAVRKIGATVSLIGPGVFLIIASYVGCNGFVVVALQSIGLSLMGCATFSIIVNVIDLSPNYASAIMGLGNGLAVTSGAIAPYIVGVLTPNQTMSEWRIVFWIVGAVFLTCNLVFLFYGSGNVQEWNNPKFSISEKKENVDEIKEGIELLPVIKR